MSNETIELLVFTEGSLNFIADLTMWADDWCKKNGYVDARIGAKPEGYTITAVPASQQKTDGGE